MAVTSKTLMAALAIAVLALSLTGCGKSKLQEYDDHELSIKYDYCLDHNPTSPGKATGCENLRKECERRAKEEGRYICRVY